MLTISGSWGPLPNDFSWEDNVESIIKNDQQGLLSALSEENST